MMSIPPKIYFFIQIGVGTMLASYNVPLMNSFFTPFLHAQGVDEGIIGWFFSFYSMTSILTSLTLSKFHRSENRHQILALGLLLIGSSLYIVSVLPLIQNFSLLIAACLLQRFVNGIGFSLFINAVYAYIQVVFNDQLETYGALVMLLASVGDFTSSLVGSSLYNLGSFYLPFATIGTLTVIYSLYILYSLKMSDQSLQIIDPLLPAAHEPQPVQYRKILNCQVVTCLILIFSLIFTLAYIAPFYSNYIIDEFHISQQDVGYYTFIPSVATALSVLLNSGIHSYMRRLLVGGLFFAGFFTPFTGPDYRLTIVPHTLTVSLACYSISNFFYGFPSVRVLVVLNKQLVNQLQDKEQAAVLGSVLFTSFSGLGEITGPIAGGYIIKLTSFPTACSLLGVYTIVLSIYSGFSLLIRNKRQKIVQNASTLEDTIISQQPQKGEIN